MIPEILQEYQKYTALIERESGSVGERALPRWRGSMAILRMFLSTRRMEAYERNVEFETRAVEHTLKFIPPWIEYLNEIIDTYELPMGLNVLFNREIETLSQLEREVQDLKRVYQQESPPEEIYSTVNASLDRLLELTNIYAALNQGSGRMIQALTALQKENEN